MVCPFMNEESSEQRKTKLFAICVVSLERVVSSVKQTYGSMLIRLLNLTDKQTTQIVTVRDLLVAIGTSAFPAQVILDANPEVLISDENVIRAAETPPDSKNPFSKEHLSAIVTSSGGSARWLQTT